MENRIYTLRREHGYTQEQLAALCKVSSQTIQAVENNQYDPTLSLAFSLAHALDTTVNDLFQKPEEAEPKPISFPGAEAQSRKHTARRVLAALLAIAVAAGLLGGGVAIGRATVHAEMAERMAFTVSDRMRYDQVVAACPDPALIPEAPDNPKASYRLYSTQVDTGSSVIQTTAVFCCRTCEYGYGWDMESIEAAWLVSRAGMETLSFGGSLRCWLLEESGKIEYYVEGDCCRGGAMEWSAEKGEDSLTIQSVHTPVDPGNPRHCVRIRHHEYLDYCNILFADEKTGVLSEG